MTQCPQCGYNSAAPVKKVTNAMNEYRNSKGDKGVFNSEDEKLTIGEGAKAVVWIRSDLWKAAESMTLKPTETIKVSTPPKQ